MTALQWALLILSLIIVVALVALSRREKAPKPESLAPDPQPVAETPPPRADQLDIFDRAPEREPPTPESIPTPPQVSAAPPAPAGFDEFGVGKPRRRTAPSLGDPMASAPMAPSAAGAADQAEPTLGSAPEAAPPPSAANIPERVSERRQPPAFLRTPSPGLAPASPSTPEPPPVPAMPEKIVTLLIAEREGNPILGPKIHTALRAQGLVYGAKQVYYRLQGDKTVYAVASLVKPGVLIPEEAAGFSTPGLSVFMVLPGPLQPVVALQDMMSTALALGRSLNAEVYDARKMPLDSEAMRTLQADVESWSKGR